MTSHLVLHKDNDNQFSILAKHNGTAALATFLGMGLKEHKLPLTKVPGSGGTIWQVPGLSGEKTNGEELDMLLTLVKFDQRGMFFEEFGTGEAGPPDCESDDGRKGFGRITKGGEVAVRECAKCPMNQFESARKGMGKACGEKAVIIGFLPENRVPTVINVPTMSIEPLRMYVLDLWNRGLDIGGVVTRMTLHVEKNKGGTEYAKIKFESVPGSELDADARKEALEMTGMLQESYGQRSIEVVMQQSAHSRDGAKEEPREVESVVDETTADDSWMDGKEENEKEG